MEVLSSGDLVKYDLGKGHVLVVRDRKGTYGIIIQNPNEPRDRWKANVDESGSISTSLISKKLEVAPMSVDELVRALKRGEEGLTIEQEKIIRDNF